MNSINYIKNLLIILLPLIFFSCNKLKSSTEKAQELITDTLKITLNDFKSYQSVSWGKLDSFKTNSNSDPNILRLASQSQFFHDMNKRAQQEMADAIYYQDGIMYEKNYHIAIKTLKIMKAIVDSITYFDKKFKPKFIGYTIVHKFRTNNSFGKPQIYSYIFFFNKNLTKVDSIQNTN